MLKVISHIRYHINGLAVKFKAILNSLINLFFVQLKNIKRL